MTYFDHEWHGSPSAMAAALTAIGWAPAGSETAIAMPAHIAGIVGPVVADYGDQPTWTATVRATEALAFPEGVSPIPADMSPDPREALGRIAALSPRVISASAFLGRFTADETAALWTADPRLMAGAMKVMTQGSANLDSPDAKALMDLAVARQVLTAERAAAILA